MADSTPAPSDAVDDLAELDAMTAVVRALSPLPEDVRTRILRWAAEKYAVTIPKSANVSARADAIVSDESDLVADAEAAEEEIAETEPDFVDFGDLFAAADPRTNEDKGLVAAYWRQVHENEEKWQAAALQKDLRNLGHAIPNITDALTSNMRKRPQRIIQVQKAGSAKQARKTYKVTRAGLMHVKAMLDADA